MAVGLAFSVLLVDDGEAVLVPRTAFGERGVPARPAGTRYIAAAAGLGHAVFLRTPVNNFE